MSKPILNQPVDDMNIYTNPILLNKSDAGRFKLVIGGDLDEYRCPSCGKLLMKGKNLEKSIVEIKCKWCGALARTY